MSRAAGQSHVQRKREARRGSILRAAIGEFARRGYERTTMQDIAAALDMTSASLYYYFKAKDEVLFAALDTVLGELILALDAALAAADGDPADSVRRLIAAHVTFELEDPTVGPFVNTHLYGPPYLVEMIDAAGQAELRAKQRAIYQRYRRCVDQWPDAPRAERAMMTFDLLALAQYPVVWFRADGGLTVSQVAMRQADLAVRLLADHAGPAGQAAHNT